MRGSATPCGSAGCWPANPAAQRSCSPHCASSRFRARLPQGRPLQQSVHRPLLTALPPAAAGMLLYLHGRLFQLRYLHRHPSLLLHRQPPHQRHLYLLHRHLHLLQHLYRHLHLYWHLLRHLLRLLYPHRQMYRHPQPPAPSQHQKPPAQHGGNGSTPGSNGSGWSSSRW